MSGNKDSSKSVNENVSRLANNDLSNSVIDKSSKLTNKNSNKESNEDKSIELNNDSSQLVVENLSKSFTYESSTSVNEDKNVSVTKSLSIFVNEGLSISIKEDSSMAVKEGQNKPFIEDLSNLVIEDLKHTVRSDSSKSPNEDLSKSRNDESKKLCHEDLCSESENEHSSKSLNGDLRKLVNNESNKLVSGTKSELWHNDSSKLRTKFSSKFINERSGKTENAESCKSVDKGLSKLVDENSSLPMDKELHNYKNNHVSTTKGSKSKKKDLISMQKNAITNDIKLLWLKNTLRFIKDDKQDALKYPAIPLKEAEFIESLINHNYKADLNQKLKSAYMAIWEAMTIFKNKYEFILKPVTESSATVQLVLEKIPKNDNGIVKKQLVLEKNPKNDNGIVKNAEVHSKTSKLKPRRQEKLNKLIKAKIDIINSVPLPFINDSLEKILIFLEDSMSASIVFKNMPRNNWTFIMNIKAIVKNIHMLVSELPEGITVPLERIAAHKENGLNFTLNENPFDISKNGKSVTLVKVPNYNSSRDSCLYNPSQERSKEQNLDDIGICNKFLKALKKPAKGEDATSSTVRASSYSSAEVPSDSSCVKNSPRDDSIQRNNATSSVPSGSNSMNSRQSITGQSTITRSASSCSSVDAPHDSIFVKSRHNSVDRRPLTQPKPSIQFQKAGLVSENVDTLTDNTSDRAKENKMRGRSHKRRLGPEKSKLLEDMSVPLESGKALRMMLMMGWDGGGLGTRGEGITEPIMPALDIITGAGLGHTIQRNTPKNSVSSGNNTAVTKNHPTKSDKTRNNKLSKIIKTRSFLLKQILEFIESTEIKRWVGFEEKLHKREASFIKSAIKSFNERTIISHKTVIEQELLRNIHNGMQCDQRLYIEVNLAKNGREIEMSKILRKNPESSPMKCKIIQFSLSQYISTLDPMEMYGVYSKKSYRNLAFRLMMLELILEFVKSTETQIIFNSDCSIFKKQMKFMINFIDSMNMRRKESAITAIEESLIGDIFNNLANFHYSFLCARKERQIKLVKEVKQGIEQTPNTVSISDELAMKNKIDEIAVKIKKDILQEIDRQKSQQTLKPEVTEEADNREDSTDMISQSSEDESETSNEKDSLSSESSVLQKYIEELEGDSFLKELNFNIDSTSKRYHSDSENSEIHNVKKIKMNMLKSYKDIYILSTNPEEKMTVNLVKIVQKLISKAIDNSEGFLPLLQCHGIVDDRLVYSCYDGNTYLWLKTIVSDKFIIQNCNLHWKGRHRLQMKLNSFIEGNTQKVLNRIKLYNSDLDTSTWKVNSKVISDDYTLLDIEVGDDAFDFISQHNFSLFAGVDKAQFSIIWN